MKDLSEKSEFDVVVVGAGIIGSACAYYLAEAGFKTLLLEQFELGHRNGSSHGASRITRHTHSSEIYVRLSMDAYREWNRLESEFQQELYTRNGLLWLSDDRDGTLERARLLKKYSVPHEIFQGHEIGEHFAHLSYDDEKWSAVWEPNGGTMLADKCLSAFQAHLKRSRMCWICENERVTNIDMASEAQIRIETSAGRTYSTKKVVVTAGAWLEKIFADLPLHVVPQRVAVNFWQIANQECFQDTKHSPNLIVTHADGEMFMIPCVDFHDKIKFGIHLGVEEPEFNSWNSANIKPSSIHHQLLSKHIGEHMPDVDANKPAVEETCLYSMTEDHNFIFDLHPKNRNVVIVGGMSGTGFKFAPVLASLVTNLVKSGDEKKSLIDCFKLHRHIPRDLKHKL